jgi:hypothetical protein
MKQVIFCTLLLIGGLNQSFSQGYSSWSSEKQQSFISNATSLIDQIFPKLVSREGWFWDKYRSGAIRITDVSQLSDNKILLEGYFGFNTSSEGEMQATAKVMGYTIIIEELWNKHDGERHNSSTWGSTTFSAGSSSSTSSSSNNSSNSQVSTTCSSCNGSGLCSTCGRTGLVKCEGKGFGGHDTNNDGHCSNCNNTGRKNCYTCSGRGACTRCKGSGKI